MASSLWVLMPHEQTHGAFSILKQIGILSPDGTKARAVKNVMKLIANSLRVEGSKADRHPQWNPDILWKRIHAPAVL